MPRKKPWTLMVYLAGDNNLTEEMAWSLQELKRTTKELGRNARHINVVAHFDPRGSRSRRYDMLPPSSINKPVPPAQLDGNLESFESVRYVLPPATGPSLSSSGASNNASEAHSPLQELQAFVRNEIERLHDAKEFFVVLSGHGSGAVGDFLMDLDPTTSLSIPELARILKLGRNAYKAKHHREKKIAVLGMDTCLMSNAEVCFEIRDHAKYLVASEGWVPNAGWPYHRVMEAIVDPTNGPVRAPDAVAKRVAESYSAFYRDYEVAGISTDIAVCDLDAFRPGGVLVRLLRHFTSECIPRLEAEYTLDVLASADVQPGQALPQAPKLLRKLSRSIARALVPKPGTERAALEQKLDGTAGAASGFQRGRNGKLRDLSASQLEALRALLDSIEGRYHLDRENLEARAKKRAKRLMAELNQPSSVQNALAAARVLREFDPGVLEALRRVEQLDANKNPLAMRARCELQKLHQVRWFLDLKKLVSASGLSDASPRLRDVFVSARWHAQSFKGGIYVDLFDLCRCLESRLSTNDPLWQTCREIQDVVGGSGTGERVVLLSRHTGRDFQHAHGLSVYFPVQARDYSAAYENLELAEQTGWGRLVRAYLCLTRRGRRDESRHWVKADDQVQRYGEEEIDPLEMDDCIEARIAGVTGRLAKGSLFSADKVRSGTDKRVRSPFPEKGKGGVPGKIRGGVPGKIRGGVPGKIRGGVPGKIRGEDVLGAWGNPPDGFFRQQD